MLSAKNRQRAAIWQSTQNRKIVARNRQRKQVTPIDRYSPHHFQGFRVDLNEKRQKLRSHFSFKFAQRRLNE